MSLIIELWEGDKQVAEMPMQEIVELDRKQWADFWHVQDVRERAIKLRIEEGEK